MKGLLLLVSCCAAVTVACGSPVNNGGANRSAAVNTSPNSNAYSRSENAYTFAQISQFTYELAPSGKEARELVGKTVTESKLWQNKAFTERLGKLMGPDYATMRKFWNDETPIRKFGDFLMMTGCEKYNCTENQYVIFIDLGDGRINVIHINKDAVKEWHAYREIEYLPPPFEEELKRMKARE